MLYNGTLYWPHTYNKKDYPALTTDHECDVLIIGGGMSGAFCAFRMAEAGYKTTLIEQFEVGMMSSAANTGLLQFMSDKSLHDCIKDFGPEKAYQFYRDAYEGMNDIREIARLLPADVRFIERDSVLYPSKKKDEKWLKKEYIALRKFGFPCELLDQSDIKKYELPHHLALLTRYDAEINPFIFVQRLLEYASEHFNLAVYEHTKLTKWSANNAVTATANNKTIRAQHMIYAGGYADDAFTKKIKKKRLVSTFAIVTKPLAHPLQSKAMYWETARPYFYFRSGPDNRMIIGGLDERAKRIPSDVKIKRNAKKLKKQFEQLFPQHPIEIEEAYGARFAETTDGLPFIGRHPKHPNVFMLLGYGGNGTVYSAFGSKLLRSMIQGKMATNLYNPGR